MPTETAETAAIDWSLTTWEGARREQLRRWSALTLEEIIRAQEDMQDLADRLITPEAASARYGYKGLAAAAAE